MKSGSFKFLLLGALAVCAGCAISRPLKGGQAITTRQPSGGFSQTVSQGQNPAAATRQTQETLKVRTYTLPSGTRIESSSQPTNPTPVFVLASPVPVTERDETRALTELGAAQKDTARELGAKLSSLKGVVWVGVGLLLFGLTSLVWPPLKFIVASVTTSVVIITGGLALIVLPYLVVGNELLILGGVALCVAAWFFAHRHGCLRGKLASASSFPRTHNTVQTSPRARRNTGATGSDRELQNHTL